MCVDPTADRIHFFVFRHHTGENESHCHMHRSRMIGWHLLLLEFLLGLVSYSPIDAATQSYQNDHHPNSSASISRSLQTRIIGGVTADAVRFPYYTYLVFDTDNGPYRCGGTLIHPDIVMGAAHCYQELIHSGIEIKTITAWVNMTLAGGVRTGYEYSRNVVQHLLHPAFDDATNANDIALFKLHQEVSTVPLPQLPLPGRTPRVGARVKAIGRGLISEYGMYSSTLQVVEINMVSYRDCNDWDSYNGAIDRDTMICAGTDQGGKDACSGDSGGPLLRQKEFPGDDVIIGITSWGTGCGRAEKFGVYAKVSSFIGFIRRGICDMSSHVLPSCLDNDAEFPP